MDFYDVCKCKHFRSLHSNIINGKIWITGECLEEGCNCEIFRDLYDIKDVF